MSELYEGFKRTTLGNYLSDYVEDRKAGIYLLSCYPSLGCIYIGMSQDVSVRLRQHLKENMKLGDFIKKYYADACGWRLDIFYISDKEKRIKTEKKLIEHFRPILNEQHLGEYR